MLPNVLLVPAAPVPVVPSVPASVDPVIAELAARGAVDEFPVADTGTGFAAAACSICWRGTGAECELEMIASGALPAEFSLDGFCSQGFGGMLEKLCQINLYYYKHEYR